MDRETVEEIKRHFGVVAEDLRSEIRAVAEGLGSLRGEMHDGFAAVAREFEETRGMIRLSYGELDRRMRDLESEVAGLRTRLDRVEARLAS